ncbi:myeloid-associated differentiation marker homolog [Erpetoichthys calabaricus]|uniref:myeloid-associated differentiation marker homolog n=1 Tax=Erpetoichthys calabaricus TaxID=27687 RepID=UPI0010A08645|nr:myeloid-associated differentiation marker homolog [Erpetoichthys calabaricus]
MEAVRMNYRSACSPIGIVRFLEIFLSCVAFSLVASAGTGAYAGSYGAWCMFSWCFCFAVSVLIVLLELFGLQEKVPISWDDFTTAFAMLATLMQLTASIIYPVEFLNGAGAHSYKAAATAMSCLCFVAYAVEVGLTRAKPGEISGFLTTVPGLLKVLESFVACIIFISINDYARSPGTQWCLAVYCICFIFAVVIMLFTIFRIISYFPFSFDKVLMGYNVLAIALYASASIIWPIFCFDKAHGGTSPRPANCGSGCPWDGRVVVAVLSFFNLVVYVVDTVYSVRLVFFIAAA